MIMKKNKIQLFIAFVLLSGSYQAYSQAVFPEVTVNLSYPQYQRLKLDGGYVYIEGAGLRGIILYREGENSFRAYERACPHHPEESCAVVQVDGSSLFMVDHCCKSTFNFSDGQPTGGPAQRALLQYRIEITGTVLKISDEIIN
jgi:nitrite reductase/ring-hydroxylating ferredoxin subunit